MKNIGIVIGGLLLAGILAFGWYQGGYNAIVSKDQIVKAKWAQVENQLQRRFDLIPNLVNTVKGYQQHEASLLTEVTRLRTQWSQAQTTPEKVEAANGLSSVLSRLLVVSENYPDLKANQNFITLQSQLEGTENRISVERMRYNEAAGDFNTYQKSFMGRFFASQTGLTEPAVYFKAQEGASAVPVVKF